MTGEKLDTAAQLLKVLRIFLEMSGPHFEHRPDVLDNR